MIRPAPIPSTSSSRPMDPGQDRRLRHRRNRPWSPWLTLAASMAVVYMAINCAPSVHAQPSLDEPPIGPASSVNAQQQPLGNFLARREFAARSQQLMPCLGAIQPSLEIISPELNSSAVYFDASKSHNVNFHYHPRAIVFPRDHEQVAAVMRCVHRSQPSSSDSDAAPSPLAVPRSEVAVSARSGSCDFASFGSGGMDGSLVVDLAHLDTVRLLTPKPSDDGGAEDVLAEVGPAARLGDVVKQLWAQGRRGMPHGTCPQVGVGGHALCGGVGPLSRHWGFTTDTIVEMDVVLANGTTAHLSASEHPELLWGMKGAGSKLAIATRFLFRTQPVDHPFTHFEYQWRAEPARPPSDNATAGTTTAPVEVATANLAKLLEALQRFAKHPDLPSEVGFHLLLTTVPETSEPGAVEVPLVRMRGMYIGPREEFRAKMRPIWEHVRDGAGGAAAQGGTGSPQYVAPMPQTVEEEEMDYVSLFARWDDFAQRPEQRLDVSAERNMHLSFLARSRLVLGQRGFSVAGLERALGVWFDDEVRRPVDLEARAKEEIAAEMRSGAARRRQAAGASQPLSTKNYRPACFLELFGGARSALVTDADAARASSVGHRDALWLVQCSVTALPTNQVQPSGLELLERLHAAWRQALRHDRLEEGGYSCYLDPTLKSWAKMYFGHRRPGNAAAAAAAAAVATSAASDGRADDVDGALGRLERLKRSVDPSDTIRNPQSLLDVADAADRAHVDATKAGVGVGEEAPADPRRYVQHPLPRRALGDAAWRT